jgi:pilus assembly protein CpaC
MRSAFVAAFIIVILVATPQAQQPVAFSGSPNAVMSGSPAVAPSGATSVDLLVGRSTILNVASPISRVSLTVPEIADAMVTSPQQLLIHGKTPGTISLFVWDRAGGISTYEVTVRRDLTRLVEQVKQLFPGEPITVTGSGKEVVLSGTVTSKYVVDKAAEVAAGYVEKKEDVVNLLKQQEGVASNQVLLRVRFAEVSRSAMQELGASLFLNQFKSDSWFARSTTQQFPAPDFDSSKPGALTFSDFLNLFVFNSKQGFGAVVKALENKGLFQSLAEPNLIALNGKEASFLAGGEYPYPIVQPGSGGNSVTIMFKEFGVRLSFTPTVLNNDLINLKVRPEVSSLDFSNAIILQGFRVPALSTRRTETEVELQDGQTFAIAGLLNNTLNNTMQKIPGIGDIPVLGYLFKSRAYQKNQTELVVMITPQIVRRGSTGVSEGLPSLVEPYLGGVKKPVASPDPYTGSPRYPAAPKSGKPGGEPQPEAPQAPAAAAPFTPQPAMPAAQPLPAQPVPQQAIPQQAVAAESVSTPAAAVAASQRTTSPAQQQAPAEATQSTQPKPDAKTAAREKEAARKAAEAQKAADKKAADEQAIADRKAAEEQAIADKKAAQEKAAADKKAAEEAVVENRRKLEEKERQDKLDKERAKREAEVARKNAEADRKKQEEDKKHDKAVADAAQRLKDAQAAYQAQVDKKKVQ